MGRERDIQRQRMIKRKKQKAKIEIARRETYREHVREHVRDREREREREREAKT